MIKIQEEYNNACNFIDSDMELYDFQLSEKMSSYEYNLYLQDTEYFLNFLYEKIRTLEELCDYLDVYVDVKIRNAKEKIRRDTAFVKKSMAAFTEDKSVSVKPVWKHAASTYIEDRDGTVLPIAEQKDTMILPVARKNNPVTPLAFLKTKANNAYQDNISTAVRDGIYLASYQRSSYAPTEEEILITLPDNASFNCVDIDPIGCHIQLDRTETGIKVKMIPDSYVKEFRNFDYDPFTGSTLNKSRTVETNYDPMKTLADNKEKQDDRLRQQLIDQYRNDVLKYQQTVNRNQSKSNVLGSI